MYMYIHNTHAVFIALYVVCVSTINCTLYGVVNIMWRYDSRNDSLVAE